MSVRQIALASAVLLACSFVAVHKPAKLPIPEVENSLNATSNATSNATNTTIAYAWYPAGPAISGDKPSVNFGGRNDSKADNVPYDALRYLQNRKPPDGFILPRRHTSLLPGTGLVSRPDGVWQDDAALAVLHSWFTTLAIIPRLLQLLSNIPGSFEMHRRVQAAEAVHYPTYAAMHEAAHAALSGTAEGTQVALTVEATPSQLMWSPRRTYRYIFTHVQGYITHGSQEGTSGSSGASEQQTSTTSAPTSDNAARAQGQPSTARIGSNGGTHGGGGSGGDGDEPDRSTPPGSTHQHPGTGVQLTLSQIKGMAKDAQLLALGVQYENLHHLQQRSLLWHQARLCRITASEVPCITAPVGKPHYDVTWQQLMDKKVQWDEDILFGRTPDFNQGFSEQALRRMAVGVQQEGPTVAEYLQQQQHIWQGSYHFAAREYGMFIHPSVPWLAASPDRVIVATDPTTGEESSYLLEVKVCVDSVLPQTLPEHVKQQVMVQIGDVACCGHAFEHVKYSNNFLFV